MIEYTKKIIFIAITPEGFIADEASLIMAALDSGIDRVHIRKPGAAINAVETLLRGISTEYYSRLSIHEHLSLATQFGLGGVHLNSRNCDIPHSFVGVISRSCHSIHELTLYSNLDYLMLSPIFDSVSKPGYASAFKEKDIKKAADKGVINKRTIALGGIKPENVSLIKSMGFGGCAVLGYIWAGETISSVRNNIKKLISSY